RAIRKMTIDRPTSTRIDQSTRRIRKSRNSNHLLHSAGPAGTLPFFHLVALAAAPAASTSSASAFGRSTFSRLREKVARSAGREPSAARPAIELEIVREGLHRDVLEAREALVDGVLDDLRFEEGVRLHVDELVLQVLVDRVLLLDVAGRPGLVDQGVDVGILQPFQRGPGARGLAVILG